MPKVEPKKPVPDSRLVVTPRRKGLVESDDSEDEGEHCSRVIGMHVVASGTSLKARLGTHVKCCRKHSWA